MIKFLTLLLPLLFFIGCGENTDNPVVKEIDHIAIDSNGSSKKIYTLQNSFTMSASVYFNDASTADITNLANWSFIDSTNYSVASLFGGVIKPLANSNANLSFQIEYASFQAEENATLIKATAIDINDSDVSSPIDTTQIYTLYADLNFSDGATIQAKSGYDNNISWSVEGNVTLVEVVDGAAKVQFSSGDSNVTVTFFDINKTKSYSAP